MINYFCLYGATRNEVPIDAEEEARRIKQAIAKVTIFVVGLLLIVTAVGLHFNHVNVTTVASLGAVGGFLIAISLALTFYHQRNLKWEIDYARERKDQNAREELHRQLKEWAQKGETQNIREALKDYATIPPTVYSQPFEPLPIAALAGDLEMVRFYLDKNADPSAYTQIPGLRNGDALSCALSSNGPQSLECMQLICERAPHLVAIEFRNDNPFFTDPLTQAFYWLKIAENPHKPLLRDKIEFLIKQGANIRTPLNFIVGEGDVESLEFLLGRGADPRGEWKYQTGGRGSFTLAHLAVGSGVAGSARCLEILCQRYPELVNQRSNGQTPLEHALNERGFSRRSEANLELLAQKVNILLEAGADGSSALGAVVYFGLLPVLERLVKTAQSLRGLYKYGTVADSVIIHALRSPYRGSLSCMKRILEIDSRLATSSTSDNRSCIKYAITMRHGLDTTEALELFLQKVDVLLAIDPDPEVLGLLSYHGRTRSLTPFLQNQEALNRSYTYWDRQLTPFLHALRYTHRGSLECARLIHQHAPVVKPAEAFSVVQGGLYSILQASAVPSIMEALSLTREKVDFLVEEGILGQEALGMVAYLGSIQSLKKLLATGKPDFSQIYHIYGRDDTLLNLALRSPFPESLDCVRLILQQVPQNFVNNPGKKLAPLEAAFAKDESPGLEELLAKLREGKLKLLLEHGADVNAHPGIKARIDALNKSEKT